jgi:dipeptidyl aminopeptidase/acylaminoacyl peptidase
MIERCASSLVILLASFQGAAAAAENGTVASDARCEQHSLAYDQFAERFRAGVARETAEREKRYHALAHPTPEQTREFEKAKTDRDVRKPIAGGAYDELFHGKYECRRIRYFSDGLQVVAYALHPTAVSGRLPVVLFLRGGNRDFGRVDEELMSEFLLPFLRAGYAVLAPQYRGADGGEGKDEFGGADVHDVLNLVPLARAQPWADADQLFLYGVSRGGMESWLALRAGLPVRAAVVHAGPTDLEEEKRNRPEMEKVWAQLAPGYAGHEAVFFEARSAQRWAAEIHVPVLILHGTADWRVSPQESLAMAAKLQSLGREYGLIMFTGDDHGLSANRDEALRRSVAWFAAHSGKAPSQPRP